MRYNLHTHTFYCRHGEGTVREYVEEAERQKLDLLGFSEHNPYPDDAFTSQKDRMYYASKASYIQDVMDAKNYSSIPVLLGWECDYYPGYEGIVEELKGEADYLIMGIHQVKGVDGEPFNTFTDKAKIKGNIARYADAYIKAMASGHFLFGNHPDVFLSGYKVFDEEARAVSKAILDAAKDLDFPLEVNANGFQKAFYRGYERRYPSREFWEMAKERNIRCVINTDCHEVPFLTEFYGPALAFAEELQLHLLEPKWEQGKLTLL